MVIKSEKQALLAIVPLSLDFFLGFMKFFFQSSLLLLLLLLPHLLYEVLHVVLDLYEVFDEVPVAAYTHKA